MGNLREAIAEYAAIVEGTREEYTQEELTVSIIRQDHPELDFMDDDEIQEIIDFANRGREKWYVVIETQADGKNYVGINDDSYCGDNIISEHDSEGEADAAAQEHSVAQGLPLFADYREGKRMEKKLYRCCNTCAHKDNSFYQCSKASECYNGFSAYSPNEEIKKQESKIETEKPQPASRS